MAKPKPNRTYLIAAIAAVAAVVVAVVGITWHLAKKSTQPSYFNGNEVKVIQIDTSTGPVTPEFQQSQSLILTPTSCNYTVTRFKDGNTPVITNCTMNDTVWNNILTAYNNDNVASIISTSSAATGLIGGPDNSISITSADGNQAKAAITTEVQTKLQPFLGDLNAQVPEVSQLKF